jgi:(S)-sulfolactate dehydrogenase
MFDIIISEFMDEAAIDSLRRDYRVHYAPHLADAPDELRDLARTSRALIVRNRTQVNRTLLSACERLRVVGRLGVGLDNIDLAGCRERDVRVMPATGANDVAVAEYVIAGLLMLLRGAYLTSAAVASGEWPRQQLIGRELGGTRLGLVGFGGIAREVAARARALGVTVTAYDPYLAADADAWGSLAERCDTLTTLLESSDAVSLHVPLTQSTRHLIGAEQIERMRRGAVLINTSRGGIVQERALADALHSGHLGGAMLDVFEAEPLPAGSALEGVPNLILTPHIAGVTRESNVRVSEVTAANVRKVLEGVRR